MTHEEFMKDLREKNAKGLQFGIDRGWWESLDENNNPVPFPIVFNRSDFSDYALTGHALVKAGIATSVKEAKRNGWTQPLECKTYKIKKPFLRIIKILDK